MGYDSTIKIKRNTISKISNTLIELGYEKIKNKSILDSSTKLFKFYSDDNFKYFEGVLFSISKVNNNYYLSGRNSIYASEYDLIKHNNTIKSIIEKFDLEFCTDEGENSFFPVSKHPSEGITNGLFFIYWRVSNQLESLKYFLSSVPKQTHQEKTIQQLFGNVFQREIYGSNICIIHLVTIMELFYRQIFRVLLQFDLTDEEISTRFKLRFPYNEEFEKGQMSLIDAAANSCSFQNIESICRNFNKLNPNINLQNLYSSRSRYYDELSRIFKQRHENVHLLLENDKYSFNKFMGDSLIVEKAIKKCYRYLCKVYRIKHLK